MIASTFVASGDNLGIFSIKPDGTEYKILTENGENPTWSPDGSFLAFERPYEDKKNDIWILDIENMRFSNLTHGKGDNGAPAWSPDGSQIAFESDRTGDWDIWVMNADGSNPVNLTGDF